MKSLVTYLSSHKSLSACIALIYYLLVVVPHEWVGKLVEKYLDVALGRTVYNQVVLIVACLLSVVVIVWVIKRLRYRKGSDSRILIILLAFCLFLIGLSLNLIIVINIELIHVLQYATMAFLLFPLFSNYRETLFWVTVLGALDELYQYVVLAPDKNDYFDFNDVILNMLGACLALTIMRIGEVKAHNKTDYSRSSASYAMILMVASILAGYFSGVIGIYPSEHGSGTKLFQFIKEYEPGFWHSVYKAKPFHIVRPLEGIIIIAILFNMFKMEMFGQSMSLKRED